MFDSLKKKLSDAIKSFSKSEERKVVEEAKEVDEDRERRVENATERGNEEHAPQESREDRHEAEEKNEKGDKGIKLSISTNIKKAVFSSVKLSDCDIDKFTDQLRVSMLESDVSFDVVEEFSGQVRSLLGERRLSSRNLQEELVGTVREALLDILKPSANAVDIMSFIPERIASGNAPVKVLFLGPNGTGKTTTIAKIAYALKNKGMHPLLSASDTFRAAAIEQTEHHGNAVGVPVIKSSYGADPTSVAFDAVAYAKAHGNDVVLIDSAGRQETNKSLMEEIKKMVRISKPDLKVFVGESIVGNALLGQVKEFDQTIKLDGIILTKLDCDAKGGNTLSILSDTTIPVLYFGIGEGYNDIMAYDPNFIMDNIVPNN